MTRSRAPLRLGAPSDWKVAEERLYEAVVIYERLPDRERAWLTRGLRSSLPTLVGEGDWAEQYARLMATLDGLAAHEKADFWNRRSARLARGRGFGADAIARADEAMAWTPAYRLRLGSDAMDQAGYVVLATTMRAWSLVRDFTRGRRLAASLVADALRVSAPTVRRWRKHGLERVAAVAGSLAEVDAALTAYGRTRRGAFAA